jgi:hypothetical protein
MYRCQRRRARLRAVFLRVVGLTYVSRSRNSMSRFILVIFFLNFRKAFSMLPSDTMTDLPLNRMLLLKVVWDYLCYLWLSLGI